MFRDRGRAGLDLAEMLPGCFSPPAHRSACALVSQSHGVLYPQSSLLGNRYSSCAKKTHRPLFDEHLLYASDFAETEVPNRFLFARKNDESLLEIWTVGVDVGRILCGLFNSIHFLLACLLVHGTYHDRLPEGDVSG